MVSQTNEQTLEAAIEKKLCGICWEDIRETIQWNQVGNQFISDIVPIEPGSHGYELGLTSDYDKQYGIDKKIFWQFLEKTQGVELEKLKRSGLDWQSKILERFDRLVKKQGLLHLLKKGLSVNDAHFHLMYPAPLASSSAAVKKNFGTNIFSCTRQITYSNANPLEKVNVVLFINGLPFATLELKNPSTGQTARDHGQEEYFNRDMKEPLFQFGRCLVHMAVDSDEVYMTTKLAGKNTSFVPFNKVDDGGAGNPSNSFGHKTSYLWKEVFSRKSVANIIQRFMRMDGSVMDQLGNRTLYFPYYHQLGMGPRYHTR